MKQKTYIETYKIWEVYFSEERARFYAYDSLLDEDNAVCCASSEFLTELYPKLDKLWEQE